MIQFDINLTNIFQMGFEPPTRKLLVPSKECNMFKKGDSPQSFCCRGMSSGSKTCMQRVSLVALEGSTSLYFEKQV